MANYMIRFLICNIFICGIIEILVTAKKIFKNILSSRMQYNLWFFLLGLLAIPFVPFRLFDFQQIFLLFKKIGNFAPIIESTSVNAVFLDLPEHINFASDFAISINNKTSSFAGLISFGIWIIGMFTMVTFIIRSYIRLYHLKKSALSLQHKEVRSLYHQCLAECQIKQNIPIYSTAFLKSPIMVGFLNPCIYLPIHAVSEYNAHDMRYMLLHELQHYKHKDALINHIINIAGIVYWFNPFIWHALKEMRYDREVACDTSVLKLLQEEDYKDYGNTLINYAEKVSLTPFPFASGISGNMKQMKKRILNIAAYKKPSIKKRIYGILSFGMIAALLFCLAPMLSTYAAEENYYQWNSSSKNISYVDYSSYFKSYEGCFVLYDSKNDTWNIHNLENATLRVSPDSTYKIYDALFGLEENIITPADSFMKWNHENYPFKEWNMD